MKKIKHILVPTDFSATSRNAYQYAKVLAEACDADITVLHVSEPFIPISDIAVAPLAQNEDNKIADALEGFVNEETNASDIMVQVKTKTKAVKGEPISRIVEYSSHNAVDMIVMGTTGLQDFISKIIGSTSLDVAKRAHCPVVLVPRDAKWQPIQKILFATTYEAATPKIVREISDFSEIFKAKVFFVHVDNTPWDEDTDADRLFEELFTETDPSFAFEIQTIKGKDIVKSLKKYANRNDIDALVLVNKQRSFWQNLIHNSVTENIAISTDKPLIVMHFDDNE